jgi:hypothetical protein
MSTRSNISVQQPDGTFLGIYCHSDGYLEWMGHILQKHFATPEAAAALVALGDISCISRFGGPYAYHREDGEPWDKVKPHPAATLQDMRDFFADAVSYFYCFHDGAWHVSSIHQPRWEPLANALIGTEDRTA